MITNIEFGSLNGKQLDLLGTLFRGMVHSGSDFIGLDTPNL